MGDSRTGLGTFEQYMQFATPDMLDVHYEMQRLPAVHQRAFAGNCAERWYPAYRALTAELAMPEELRPLLDAFWQHLLGRTLSVEDAEDLVARCVEVRFGEENESDYFWEAVGAVGAAWCALMSCCRDPVEFAVRASATISDNVFQIARCEEGGTGILTGSEIDAHHLAISRHPLMIEERARQRAVLCFLRQRPMLSPQDIVEVQRLGVTDEGPWKVGVNIARASRAGQHAVSGPRLIT